MFMGREERVMRFHATYRTDKNCVESEYEDDICIKCGKCGREFSKHGLLDVTDEEEKDVIRELTEMARERREHEAD